MLQLVNALITNATKTVKVKAYETFSFKQNFIRYKKNISPSMIHVPGPENVVTDYLSHRREQQAGEKTERLIETDQRTT